MSLSICRVGVGISKRGSGVFVCFQRWIYIDDGTVYLGFYVHVTRITHTVVIFNCSGFNESVTSGQ